MSMILYNIRSRGPYEYDKFVLNFLQMKNEIDLAEKEYKKTALSLLKDKENEIVREYERLTGNNNISQQLLMMKEAV